MSRRGSPLTPSRPLPVGAGCRKGGRHTLFFFSTVVGCQSACPVFSQRTLAGTQKHSPTVSGRGRGKVVIAPRRPASSARAPVLPPFSSHVTQTILADPPTDVKTRRQPLRIQSSPLEGCPLISSSLHADHKWRGGGHRVNTHPPSPALHRTFIHTPSYTEPSAGMLFRWRAYPRNPECPCEIPEEVKHGTGRRL